MNLGGKQRVQFRWRGNAREKKNLLFALMTATTGPRARGAVYLRGIAGQPLAGRGREAKNRQLLMCTLLVADLSVKDVTPFCLGTLHLKYSMYRVSLYVLYSR